MATVLQISDTHLCAEPNTPAEHDPDASLSATLDAIRDVAADLLLLTGDLADDGSLAAVQRLRDAVCDLAPRIMAVAGNHDDIDNVHATFGEVDSIQVGAWRVLAVETYIAGEDHGYVDVEQLVRRLDQVDDRYDADRAPSPTALAEHQPDVSAPASRRNARRPRRSPQRSGCGQRSPARGLRPSRG